MKSAMMLACENCRKRKVRCSGTPTISCSNCDRQNVPCYFDQNRRRRGPRQKRPNAEAEARTTPGPVDGPASDPKVPVPPPAVAERLSASTRVAPSSSGHVTQRDVPFSLDGMKMWRERLIVIMGGEKYYLASDFMISVDQTVHLLLAFCITANGQQCPVLSPTTFLEQLEAGNSTRHLCHAMCAVGLRFSRHKSTQAASLDEALVADSREELAMSQDMGGCARFQRLLTVSVLSLYEIYQGNGLQAWYDLTTALNILTSLKYNPSVPTDIGILAGIDMVHNYLSVSMIFHSLGQTIQSSSAALFEADIAPGTVPSSFSGSNSSELQLRLSGLMQRCLALCRRDFTKLNPAPWSKDSKYMAFKEELDSLYILHAGDRLLDTETIEALQRKETGAGSYIMCLAMIHAMRMLLNAVFMPVAVVPVANSENQTRLTPTDQPSGSPPRQRLSLTTRKSVYFPAAPPAFRRERAATCIRSARTATMLCRSLLEQGNFLLPPFLGYTILLAGLVFLNQLQIETNSIRIDELVENLKTIFTVLGTMRAFFTPAHLWVNLLFKVHSLDVLSESAAFSAGPADLFSNFFRRFQGIPEPPYCPLSPEDFSSMKGHSYLGAATPRNPRTSLGSRSLNNTATDGMQANKNRNPNDASPKGASGAASMTPSTETLLNNYRRAIKGAIESMDKPEGAQVTRGQINSSEVASQERTAAVVSEVNNRPATEVFSPQAYGTQLYAKTPSASSQLAHVPEPSQPLQPYLRNAPPPDAGEATDQGFAQGLGYENALFRAQADVDDAMLSDLLPIYDEGDDMEALLADWVNKSKVYSNMANPNSPSGIELDLERDAGSGAEYRMGGWQGSGWDFARESEG